MDLTTADHMFFARLSERAERWDDMVDHMKHVMQQSDEMSQERRNSLSVAYKNLVGSRRAALRIIDAKMQKDKVKDKPEHLRICLDLRTKIISEVNQICDEVIDIVERALPGITAAEHRVFFYKMLGDYNRYLCEFADGEMRSQKAEKSADSYSMAQQIAEGDLPATNPIRLGLFLNFSVFFFEIKEDKETAIRLAKVAFDSAIAELDDLSEDSYKEATVIMQLLRENLCNWTEVDHPEIEERTEKDRARDKL